MTIVLKVRANVRQAVQLEIGMTPITVYVSVKAQKRSYSGMNN